MRHRLFLSILVFGGCVASAQQVPQKQDTSPPLTETEKRAVAQITKLQQKIERLENEIETHQAKIEALARTLPVSAQAKYAFLEPKVARVVFMSGDLMILDSGGNGDGFRKGDRVLFVRRGTGGLFLTGKGVVERLDPPETQCVLTGSYRVTPGDEAYIENRIGSPYSKTRIQLTIEDR